VSALEPDLDKLGDGRDGHAALRAGRAGRAGRAEYVQAGVLNTFGRACVLEAGRTCLGRASDVLGALRYVPSMPSMPQGSCSSRAEDVPGALRVPGYVLYARTVRCSGVAESASGWDSPASLGWLESGDLPVAHF
jgi:hypothetical protein